MIFPKNQKFLIFDYETYSELDLKKVGSWEYSQHHSTEVLCVSWLVGTRKELKQKLKNRSKVSSYAPKRSWNEHRKDIRKGKSFSDLLKDDSIIKVAHNSMFEQAITRNVLPRHLKKFIGEKPFLIPHKEYLCTAVMCASHALPRSLDGATAALGLGFPKDKEGHRLMLSWCKPRKPSKNNPSKRYTNNFDRLLEYCENDIYAEISIFLELEEPTPSERSLWLLDQKINFRGITVDRDLVLKTSALIEEDKIEMTKQLRKISKGEINTAGQNAVILKWLKKNGLKLPNLQAKTVSDAIEEGNISPKVKKVLELRQKLNKTSIKKYPKLLSHSTSDSKIRFSLNFNATVHGRWGGAGVQPHNFPRGTLKYKDHEGKEHDLAPFAAELIKEGITLSMLKTLFGDSSEVFVSCLRPMLCATPGKELFVTDFSAVEARVLFWLAGHIEGIKAFKEKRKMYEELAMIIFGKKDIFSVAKVERFVGKQAFLASGYGAGWKKFQSTCEGYGQPITVQVAKKAIKSYREHHAPVVQLWKNLELAAISAVEKRGKVFETNKTKWFVEGKFLVCELPSKRRLYYYGPQVKYQRTPWGASKPVLYHWTVDSKTKKWVFTKTWGGVLTQNCVGGTSRDLLASAMIRQQKAGYDLVLTVHDENIAERTIGEGSLDEFNDLMKKLPKWAKGCPIDVEGWVDFRYRK